MKEIVLTKGFTTTVDDEDFEYLNQFKWCAQINKGTRTRVYAVRKTSKTENEPGKIHAMHRYVLGAQKGFEVDHIDGNGLNNTRANLRICNHQQNNHNKVKQKNNKCGYKGVRSNGNGWQVRITAYGVNHYLGTYSDLIEAAKAYDKAAKEIHGEFANLNFPELLYE